MSALLALPIAMAVSGSALLLVRPPHVAPYVTDSGQQKLLNYKYSGSDGSMIANSNSRMSSA